MFYLNTFSNFNLFNLIVVIFCKFRSYERSEFQVHKISNKFSINIFTENSKENLRQNIVANSGQFLGTDVGRI